MLNLRDTQDSNADASDVQLLSNTNENRQISETDQTLPELSYRDAFKQFLSTSSPFIASSIVNMSGVIGCNYFLSRVDDNQLAASSLMLAVQSLVSTSGAGVLFATGIYVAEEMGANNPIDAGVVFRNALILSAGLSLAGSVVACTSQYFLSALAQDQLLVNIAQQYLYCYAASLPATLATVVYTQFSLASGHARTVFVTYLLANALLLCMGYPAIVGIPSLFQAQGALGYGLALLLSSWIVLGGLFMNTLLNPSYKNFELYKNFFHTNFSKCIRLFKDGFFIAGQLIFEQVALIAMTLFVGARSTDALEAFQIVDQYFFVGQAISIGAAHAAAILISRYQGRMFPVEARRIGNVTIAANVVFCSLVGILMCSLSRALTLIYVNENSHEKQQILDLASTIFIFRGIELIIGSFGYATTGALRGYSDTRAAMLISVLNMLVSIGLGAAVAESTGVTGIFIGRIFGVTLASALLTHRWLSKSHFMVTHLNSTQEVDLNEIDQSTVSESDSSRSAIIEHSENFTQSLSNHRNTLLNEQRRASQAARTSSTFQNVSLTKNYRQYNYIKC